MGASTPVEANYFTCFQVSIEHSVADTGDFVGVANHKVVHVGGVGGEVK